MGTDGIDAGADYGGEKSATVARYEAWLDGLRCERGWEWRARDMGRVWVRGEERARIRIEIAGRHGRRDSFMGAWDSVIDWIEYDERMADGYEAARARAAARGMERVARRWDVRRREESRQASDRMREGWRRRSAGQRLCSFGIVLFGALPALFFFFLYAISGAWIFAAIVGALLFPLLAGLWVMFFLEDEVGVKIYESAGAPRDDGGRAPDNKSEVL